MRAYKRLHTYIAGINSGKLLSAIINCYTNVDNLQLIIGLKS